MQTCKKCGTEKTLAEFAINGARKRSECKVCAAERARLWRLDHPGYATKYMREYVKKNYTVMRQRMDAKRQEIAEWKRVRGCTVCGESEPWVLDMHHLDPKTKEGNPASSATLKTFLKHAEGCVLVCSNCHRKIHAGVLNLTPEHINKFQRRLQCP